jgi:phenylacetate-CoA ligase
VIFDPELESMPRAELETLQLERLRRLVAYLRERVPLYRERLEPVEGVESLEDLRRLPFTRKEDLRDTYPFGLFAVPREECVRLHGSSGTTGKPIVVGYTPADVDVFAQVNARALAMAGAQPGMVLHNAYGYGLFTGGLGLHYGGERLGMTVVPVSGGMTERQLTLIQDFRPDLITCTPSYALTLAQAFAERGVKPDEISLRYACVGAEPWTESMRVQIDAGLGIRATNIYGLSEIIGPGVSNECVEARDGSHVNEDHFLPEIVDPKTGDPLPDGEQGVLVFTTLTKQALPLLRYWTGDITSLNREPCRCGRTLVRMGLIAGRTDDMLIVRGVNVYPTQVESVLLQVPELTPHYRLVVTREATLDEVQVEVEVAESYLRSIGGELDSAAAQPLERQVEELIRGTIGTSMRVTLLAPGAGPRSEGGKLARVDDRRRLE